MCCTRLAGNTGCNKLPFWHYGTTLSSGCIDNRKKIVGQLRTRAQMRTIFLQTQTPKFLCSHTCGCRILITEVPSGFFSIISPGSEIVYHIRPQWDIARGAIIARLPSWHLYWTKTKTKISRSHGPRDNRSRTARCRPKYQCSGSLLFVLESR